MDNKEVKPKRKYTRKKKIEEVKEKVKEEVKEEKEEVKEEKEEVKEEEKPSKLKILIDNYNKSYRSISYYIAYEGVLIDTFKYIQSFQNLLDSKKIGSQILIYRITSGIPLKLNNAFSTQDSMDIEKFDKFCLSREKCVRFLIKERPRKSPEELFDFLNELNENYEDGFIKVRLV